MYNLLDKKAEEIIEFPAGERVEHNFLTDVKIFNAPDNNSYGESIGFEFTHKPILQVDGKNQWETKNPKFGAKITLRFFDPDGSPQMVEEDKLEKNRVSLVRDLRHIIGAFMTEEEMEATFSQPSNGFGDFIRNIATAFLEDGKVKSQYANIVAALKTTYNKKNIVGKPGVPPFISTTLKVREFTTNPTYDKYEKREIAPTSPNQAPGMVGAVPPPPGVPTANLNRQANTSQPLPPAGPSTTPAPAPNLQSASPAPSQPSQSVPSDNEDNEFGV